MLKVELHTHSSDDPVDRIPHTTQDLIDRAAALGYDALAITLHDHQLDLRPFESYAMQRRIVLIPGLERTIEGRHVLLLNFERGAEQVESFEDLRQLKRQSPGLVIAPHAYYPSGTSLRGMLSRHGDLFDAVEYNAMFTTSLNFNTRAERWAHEHGRPMVGNCDVHRLEQMGTTYSLVDAPRNPTAICQAIKAGRVTVVANPISWGAAAGIMTRLYASHFSPNFRRPAREAQLVSR